MIEKKEKTSKLYASLAIKITMRYYCVPVKEHKEAFKWATPNTGAKMSTCKSQSLLLRAENGQPLWKSLAVSYQVKHICITRICPKER